MKNFTRFFLLFLSIFFYTYTNAQIKPINISSGRLVGVSKEIKTLPTFYTPEKRNSFTLTEDEKLRKIKFSHDNPNAVSADAALQNYVLKKSPQQVSEPLLVFNGNSQQDNATAGLTFAIPPDASLSVGPEHIVQMTNFCHSVYNKRNGTRISGPVKFSAIATGSSNDGDPIVLYDQIADRWLLMQFSNVGTASAKLVFCISKTPDPSGAYYIYNFPTTDVFPDYPHVGIWNNCYTVTTQEFNVSGTSYLGQGFYAIDRMKMVAGQQDVSMIQFRTSEGGYLPVSFEGKRSPDLQTKPGFWSWDADELGAASDRLMYRELNLDLKNPSNSSLSSATILNTAPFDGRSPLNISAIEQPSTATGLDAIADRMMGRVIYRRFDNYEALVMNHTVNVSGVNPTDKSTYQAAIRWYELRRNSPSDPWVIYQQSTYAPFTAGNGLSGANIWMGCVDMDQRGGLALGYSRSSTSQFPSVCYAQHAPADPLSTLGEEESMILGTGSQLSSVGRWGDYSTMAADPLGDTLWYTNEYYSTSSVNNFKTAIGSLMIPVPVTTAVHFKTNGTIVNQRDLTTPFNNSACVKYKDYPITVVIDQAPSQAVTLTLIENGTAVKGVDFDLIYTAPLVLNSSNLSKTIILRVYNGTPDNRFVNISYTLNVNGGNAVAANYNQIHNLTIFGKSYPLQDYLTKQYGSTSTVFSDNFDNVSTGLGSWTEELVYLTPGAVNSNHFIIGTNAGAGFSNKALYISNDNSTNAYSGAGNTFSYVQIRAISPAIDISGKGKVSVSFIYRCKGESPNHDFGSLWYSKDGGATWFDQGTRLVSQTTAISKTLALPDDIENIANLKIAFQWENDYSVEFQPPLAIENVVVTAQSVTSGSQIQILVNGATAPTFRLEPNSTVNFVDTAANKIMATITNNSAFDFGCTKVLIDRAGTGAVFFNSTSIKEALASKTFRVIPEFNNASASYTIKLYYTEAEIAGWEAATGNSRNGMQMVKVKNIDKGIPDVTPANQGNFNYSIIPAVQMPFGSDGIFFEATFTGFSGFGIGKPLPGLAAAEKIIVVYPNPVKDNLMINYNGTFSKGDIHIINAAGQIVYKSNMALTSVITIPVKSLAKGGYLLYFSDGTGTETIKFIKQ